MTGFALVAASIGAGLSIGAAATVGVTLVVQERGTAPVQNVPAPAPDDNPTEVQYGDRCYRNYCPPPCGSTTACLNAVLDPDDRSELP